MKIIRIQLQTVEAAMLEEIQKKNKRFRDLSSILATLIREEYRRVSQR